MHFAICDDDRQHILDLEAFFCNRPELHIDSEPYESGEALVNDYRNNGRRYDALFIDIEMGAMNGIETAHAIREMDEHVIIIFVTSHLQYSPESFECDADRYLVKPLVGEKVNEALTFIANKLKREKSTISFHYDREYIRLVCRDIYYCTSEHNGSVIYTQTSTYHTRMTLSELEEQLDSVSFCRINRGCVINLAYVQSVKGNQINFEGQELPFYIGKSYQDAFNRALVYYEEREYFG